MVQLLPLTCAQIYEDHETCSGPGPTGFRGGKLDVWVFGAHSETFILGGFANSQWLTDAHNVY